VSSAKRILLKSVVATTPGIRCTPELDNAQTGFDYHWPLEEILHFLRGSFALALVSCCCLRVAKATLYPAQGLGVRAGAMGMHGPPFTRRRQIVSNCCSREWRLQPAGKGFTVARTLNGRCKDLALILRISRIV